MSNDLIRQNLANIIQALNYEMTKNQPDKTSLRYQGETLIQLSEMIKE